MILISSAIIGLMLFPPISSTNADQSEMELTNYQKAILGLQKNDIRVDLPSEKMLDLCVPELKWIYGPFTVYVFQLSPGYCGLTIIAKDGVLKRAVEWSCTDTRLYFDELTTDDNKLYQRLRKENLNSPGERLFGRWGWESQRKSLLSIKSASQN